MILRRVTGRIVRTAPGGTEPTPGAFPARAAARIPTSQTRSPPRFNLALGPLPVLGSARAAPRRPAVARDPDPVRSGNRQKRGPSCSAVAPRRSACLDPVTQCTRIRGCPNCDPTGGATLAMIPENSPWEGVCGERDSFVSSSRMRGAARGPGVVGAPGVFGAGRYDDRASHLALNVYCSGPGVLADSDYVVPLGGGTITSFSSDSIPSSAGQQVDFRVLRPSGADYAVVGKTGLVTLHGPGAARRLGHGPGLHVETDAHAIDSMSGHPVRRPRRADRCRSGRAGGEKMGLVFRQSSARAGRGD